MLSGAEIADFSSQALGLVLQGSAPPMIGAAVAGVAIALLQALTQVQDQSLPTAVKFFAVMAILYGTYLSMASSIGAFGDMLFDRIASL
jgi:type III secretion protein S